MKIIFTILKKLNKEEKETAIEWYKKIENAKLDTFNNIIFYREPTDFDLIVFDGKNIVLLSENDLDSVISKGGKEVSFEDILFEERDSANKFVDFIIANIQANEKEKINLSNILYEIFKNSKEFNENSSFIENFLSNTSKNDKERDKEPSKNESIKHLSVQDVLKLINNKNKKNLDIDNFRTNIYDMLTPSEAKKKEESLLKEFSKEIEKLKKEGKTFFSDLKNCSQEKNSITDFLSQCWGKKNNEHSNSVDKEDSECFIVNNDKELIELVKDGKISMNQAQFFLFSTDFPIKINIKKP